MDVPLKEVLTSPWGILAAVTICVIALWLAIGNPLLKWITVTREKENQHRLNENETRKGLAEAERDTAIALKDCMNIAHETLPQLKEGVATLKAAQQECVNTQRATAALQAQTTNTLAQLTSLAQSMPKASGG